MSMATLGAARRIRVEWSGDDTFQCYQQPTEKTILNGELFKEKERVFLKRTLRLHNVSFPIGHDRTVQIELKSFWQPEALRLDGRESRGGKFVTLLSDQRPPIKDAFAWIKLVQPLYKRGFSVVLLDLPGSGGSGLNTNTEVPYEDWEEEDFRIVENALRGLQVKRTHLIAFGRSSRIILKFAKNTHINGFSTFLEREHCWYQPDIDFFALFHNEVGDCPPGKVHEWQIEAEHRHEHLLREVMKPVRIMAFHERFPEDPAVKATQQFIARARSSPEAALSEFYCTRISREDICFVRPHAALDVSIMAMAKNLMTAMADFLKTANQGDVAVPVFLPHQDVKDGKIKQCSKGCVNPRRGLHHWSCPNHPKNAGGRVPIAQEEEEEEEEDAPQQEPPKEDKLMLRSPGQRPASAPARRLAGHAGASLQSAMSREKFAQRNWVVTSQKHLALEISPNEATMRSCLYRVKDLNPPLNKAMQHQANIQLLPSDMREWTLAAEKVFEVREAAIAKAKREEEERMELLAFRPKTADTDGEEPAEPEVDSLASEVQEPVQPKSTLSTDDFLMDMDWRRGSRSPKVCNVGSKLSFMLDEAPSIPQSEDGSFRSSREVPTSDRQEPESPTATDGGISTRPDSALSGAGTRPASATQCPLSGKRPKRLGSAAGSTRPSSGTGTASTAPSRPSSATRLRDLFSSKLSRLRPTSALSRSSSSTKLSLEPAQGATSPTNAGNLASWFSNRRNLLTGT